MSAVADRAAAAPQEAPREAGGGAGDHRAALSPELRRALFEGETGVAQRRDILALHRRLSERAESDRGGIEARLAEVERALATLEARLCIELEPMLARGLARSLPAAARRPRGAGLLRLAALLAALAGGVVYSSEIKALWAQGQEAATTVLSPSGSI